MAERLQTITFRSSVSTITEFLGFAIYCVLYQRGVYPSDSFQQVTRYGVQLMVSVDEELNSYLAEVLQQVIKWVSQDKLRKLVLVLVDAETKGDVVERWVFDIATQGLEAVEGVNSKSDDTLRKEIQAVLRQVTSSVSYLPLLHRPCYFDMLVYADPDTELPTGSWELSDPRLIMGSSEVTLRSFSTSFHSVSASVAYRDGS
ncbi:Mad2-like HORMA domain containing protein [Trypanosoma equiperdum]|uniref:Rev7, putative n=2 Tax=Trypanozoon TaxID=39700 RepID=Q57ZD6_TRYB2|nr:rev7, putative [Trypanosoma brucei brucei TREU927]AAX80262.1 rev7, putative [Trypanosoma brucei]AAZ10210.1 rev7, putative [Trypanosoma brucei brucei TREU927]SCU64932.1 Mad2-like HORMA domain containing protein [Trypanosoma equiperdum]